jgi:polysaccharide biosynthesis/export protein
MKLSLLLLPVLVGAPLLIAQAPSVNPGGSVTLGPSPKGYFQPTRSIDVDLLNSLMTARRPPVVVHPEDHVKVTVFGVPAFDTEGQIESDGTLQLPYLGPVQVSGLTISEAESKIAAALEAQQLVLHPAVNISDAAQPSYQITVDGEVAHPGSFTAAGDPTLGQMISRAGGLLSTAASVVTIARKGRSEPISVPLGPDPTHPTYGQLPIFSGDEISVSKVGTYYAVGALKVQGAYPLKNATPTTVAEAIATAGGFGFEALLDSSMIVRTEGTGRVVIKVHAGKIIHGKERDVALMNDDILFVPTSNLKAAIKGGGTGFIVSLASSYIYTHP